MACRSAYDPEIFPDAALPDRPPAGFRPAPGQCRGARRAARTDLVATDPGRAPPAPAPLPIHDLANALSEAGPAASQQSPNAPVVKALDGIEAKLPGYIVPLEISEAGLVTEFLLVPYYGACIHVPPPPSNQIVYVKTAKGVQMDELYQPFWVEGTFKVENASSELAAAGYRMQASKVTPYEYEVAERHATIRRAIYVAAVTFAPRID